MAHAAQQRSLSMGAAFWLLLQETYAPGLHFAFAAGWFCALDGALSFVAGTPWRPGWHTAAGIAILFVTLFYLRAVDEWKDIDYDRQFNPGRPLARRAVTLGHVFALMATCAATALLLHFAVFTPATSAILLALDFAYGLALVYAERMSSALRDSMWLNLIFTYPVNVLLSVYTLFLDAERTGSAITGQDILLVVAFALAFLHYEFARKIAMPAHAALGRRLYSTSLGVPAAVALTAGFALGAIGLAAWNGLWLPAAAVPCVLQGLYRISTGKGKPSAPLAGPAMQFLVVFYVSLVASAIWTMTW